MPKYTHVCNKCNQQFDVIHSYKDEITKCEVCGEIGTVSKFLGNLRAMLVEKDRKPAWNPSNIKDIDDDKVNKFFESLGDQDLILTK